MSPARASFAVIGLVLGCSQPPEGGASDAASPVDAATADAPTPADALTLIDGCATFCGATCTDITADSENCGGCGFACAPGARCIGGACVCNSPDCQCNSGTTLCGRACVDTMTDSANCGGCGNRCPAGPNSYPVCVGGSCGIGCNTHFGNCDGVAGNGCESDFRSSSTSCGTCGHDCQGGACDNGTCLPAVLASNQYRIVGIAVDQNGLYWSRNGNPNEIVRLPTGSSTPVQISSNAPAGFIEAFGGDLYVFTSLIERLPDTGGTRTTLVTLPVGVMPQGAAVDSSGIYVAAFVSGNPPQGQVLKAPLGGGTASILATDGYASAVALDADSVFWVGYGNLRSVPKAGGSTSTLFAGSFNSFSLTVFEQTVYWSTTDGIVHRIPTSGGQDGIVAQFQGYASAMGADASGVYWADSRVVRASPSGTVTILASPSDIGGATFLALDDTYLYYATDQTIYRMPK